MAASTVSSSVVTDYLAGTITNNNSKYATDKCRHLTGTLSVATTSIDEANDKIILFPIMASERLVSLKLYNDDLDSNGTPTLAVDVGLYKDPTDDGTSATTIDVDAYASASTALQSASTTGTEVAFEARNITAIAQTVAEDGGETLKDVGAKIRYVGLNVETAAATAAAGDISWHAIISSR